jgi:hypothetical protein
MKILVLILFIVIIIIIIAILKEYDYKRKIKKWRSIPLILIKRAIKKANSIENELILLYHLKKFKKELFLI